MNIFKYEYVYIQIFYVHFNSWFGQIIVYN